MELKDEHGGNNDLQDNEAIMIPGKAGYSVDALTRR